jgi:2-C-methyl-D-erythritol 2,4-cyclodiphosphate synthase
MRIGHGYDVHRLSAGRRLVLGGVEIPFEKGLDGHSDADVLTHAVIDALLGAAGLGDIGAVFPDSDPAYKDACSISLLKEVVCAVNDKGFTLVNIDVTVVSQQPKLSPYRGGIISSLSAAAGIYAVNVKFTTEEGMGFTGRGEGISAAAVCLLE